MVKEELAAQGVDLLDLSFDLAAYFFTDTEHLRQPGKQYVAEQLAARIDPPPGAPIPTQSPPVMPTAVVTAVTTPVAPVNPLLATAIARATQAAGGDGATPTAPPVATPTPIANPLLATAVMRATEAAQ